MSVRSDQILLDSEYKLQMYLRGILIKKRQNHCVFDACGVHLLTIFKVFEG